MMNDWLQHAGTWFPAENGVWDRQFTPAIDVEESPSAFTLRASLPGLASEDITVNFHDGILSISGEYAPVAPAEGSRMRIRERRHGKFSRSLRFSTAIDGDAVQAASSNGLLEVTLPKAQHAQSRQIPVSVASAD